MDVKLMRDRLKKLILENDILCHTCGENTDSYCAEYLAEYLIENGVIMPPCKAGDAVYWLNFYNDLMLYRDKYYEAEVVRIVVTRFGVSCVIRVRGEHATYEIPDVEFGKTVFLTREEAERALKGGDTGA